jgi:tetratricopeptide (TPR) repeat protein
MRTIGYILVCFLAVFTANATDVDGTFSKAQQHYKSGEYAAAAELYQELLEDDMVSASVHFNLGNTYYKMDSIAKAILYFERANKLSPGDEAIERNLQMAYKKTAHEPTNSKGTFAAISNWLSGWPHNFWAYTSVALLLLGFAGWFTYLFVKVLKWRKVSFYAGVILIGLGLIATTFAWINQSAMTHSDEAIIMVPVIEVMSDPAKNSGKVTELSAGKKVTVIRENKNWYEIKLGDRKSGWVSKTGAEMI